MDTVAVIHHSLPPPHSNKKTQTKQNTLQNQKDRLCGKTSVDYRSKYKNKKFTRFEKFKNFCVLSSF